MRIGVFGGCFNPPHRGHIAIGKYLLDRGYVDKVIYVPTGNLYNKQGLVSDWDRYEMVRLALNDDDRMMVSDYEFGKLTYTYQTLDYFSGLYPNDEVFFICGSDNLEELKTWRNYREILNKYKLLVIGRNDRKVEDIIGEQYLGFRNRIIGVDMPGEMISSTEVRRDMAIGSDEVKQKVPGDVWRYIKKRNLYRS